MPRLSFRRRKPRPHPVPPVNGPITPASFTLTGKYRVPDSTIGSSSVTFSLGSLYRRNDDYLFAGPPSDEGRPVRMRVNDPPGTGLLADAPLLQFIGTESTFPVAPGTNFSSYWGAAERDDGVVLASSRSDYATSSEDWDAAYIHTDAADYTPIASSRQVYGCFLGKVPSNFTGSVGSKTWWLGQGGYRSGGGSTAGPSLLIFDPSNPNSATRVLSFGGFGASVTSENQTRPTTYDNALFNGLMPSYWQADRVRAMCWTTSGLLIWAAFGEGELNYTWQNETFSHAPKLYFGVISNADLATAIAAAGSAGVGTIRVGQWYEWTHDSYCLSNDGTSTGVGVNGAWYNESASRVDLFSTYQWNSGLYAAPAIYQFTLAA